MQETASRHKAHALPWFVNELRAVAYLASQIPRYSYHEPSVNGSDPLVVIGPGFMATGHPYYKLVYQLAEQGFRAVIMDPFVPNAHRYPNVLSRLVRIVDGIVDKYGRLDFFIGHSLGGIEGAMLLPWYHTCIKKIIALGSPYSGTPWRPLQMLTSFIIVPQKEQKRILSNIIRGAKPYQEQIVTVTTEADRICPPDNGAFPGARLNFVYYSSEDRKYMKDPSDEFMNTHSCLPYFRPVQRLLFNELRAG